MMPSSPWSGATLTCFWTVSGNGVIQGTISQGTKITAEITATIGMIILSSLTIRFFFCIFNYPSEPPNKSSQVRFLIKTHIVSSLNIPSKATRQIRVSPKNPCEIENGRHDNPRDYNSYTARLPLNALLSLL